MASSLNFKTYGSGDPVVILHGLFGSLDNWHSFAKKLSEDFMVFTLDLRNHGRSPHADSMTYSAMAEDVLEFVESQWIYKTHILGHSMGGKVAMEVARQNDDLIDQLVVLDIAPKQYPPGHQDIIEALLSVDFSTHNSRKEIENKLATKIDSLPVRQFLMKNLKRDEQNQFSWKMNLSTIVAQYDQIIGKGNDVQYDGPTSFIRGSESGYIKDADMNEIQQQFPSSALYTVENAGHWVHVAQPDRLLTLVRSIFKD